MTVREFVNQFVPPVIMNCYRKIFDSTAEQGNHLSGDYFSWNEALNASTGYDAELILEKTKTALLVVKKGEAIYERDSVLFDKVVYAWPLLAGLMWVAAQFRGRLNVLDFGGSLGSTYYQNRAFLRNLLEVQWNIVEQPAHVKVGKEYFEDEVLKFFPNIEICLSETKPNIILLSGVLQYLESPYEILNQLLDLPCDYVIIDRTPFSDISKDRLCIQIVPESIYTASFPCWIFSMDHILKNLKEHGFETVVEFEGFDRVPGPIPLSHKGLIIKRKKGLL